MSSIWVDAEWVVLDALLAAGIGAAYGQETTG